MSRRLLLIIGIVGIIILGLAGFGIAYALSQAHATSASGATATTPATNPSSTTGTNGQRNANRSVTGVISSLNNSTIQITVRKRTVNVTLSSVTTYSTLEGTASFSGLKLGQTVTVTGQLDTQALTLKATRVVPLLYTIYGHRLRVMQDAGFSVLWSVGTRGGGWLEWGPCACPASPLAMLTLLPVYHC